MGDRTYAEAEAVMNGILKCADTPVRSNRAGYFGPKDGSWCVEIGWDGQPLPSLKVAPSVESSEERSMVEEVLRLLAHAEEQIGKRQYMNATHALHQATGRTLSLFGAVLRGFFGGRDARA